MAEDAASIDSIPIMWLPWSRCMSELDLPSDYFPRAYAYLKALVAEPVNLTSLRSADELLEHVADSVQALRLETRRRARAVDVGTGGGLPGVPLALARPGWEVHLLDAARRKQEALSRILAAPPVSNARAHWGRAETLGRDPDFRERYDAAFCRAVGPLATVLELVLPLVRVGGAALLHRGAEGPGELREAEAVSKRLGGGRADAHRYRLPGMDRDRYIIRVEKSSPTPPAYPRRPGIPAKRPLKPPLAPPPR